VAQKITVALEDDLTGGPADETVPFAVDGTAYEIDLSAKNAATFSNNPTLSMLAVSGVRSPAVVRIRGVLAPRTAMSRT